MKTFSERHANESARRPAASLDAPHGVSASARAHTRDVAQRERIDSAFGVPLQRVEDDEDLQRKTEIPMQRREDEEEPLQGRFRTTQRRADEEDEPLQLRFETAHRQGAEEDELQLEAALAAPAQGEAESPALPNRTGLPDGLKTGIESLSGLSMDHVRVHYNSAQPAQLNALAYARGSDIHVAQGQERHLPHEAWHVVQQAQGRVKPTLRMKDGDAVNDDKELEQEADVMGAKAAVTVSTAAPSPLFQRRAESAEASPQQESIGRHGARGRLNFLSSGAAERDETQAARHDHRTGFEVGGTVAEQLGAQEGRGSPLPGEVRSSIEPRLGADFSGVRVHADGEAARPSSQLKADAFTQGEDTHFGAGKCSLGSQAARRLLAHELAHTDQQGAAPLQRQPIQRHPQGTELKDKDAEVAEIGEKEKDSQKGKPVNTAKSKASESPPSATRTKQVEAAEKREGRESGAAFTTAQALNPGAMSLAAAQKILQGAYGGTKKIVPGTIVILADQPACATKYDEVCTADGIMHGDRPWRTGDRAADDAAAGVQTEGFAWKGVVYVNGKTPLVTATAHEILHNNTEPKFRKKMGETFNEGTTEILARKALKDSGITVPSVTAYPNEVAITQILFDFFGSDLMEKAYFEDVMNVVRRFAIQCPGTWKQLTNGAAALDATRVQNALKRN